ncbi:hypothetical protein V8E52_011877, partial [Russula decolorans]
VGRRPGDTDTHPVPATTKGLKQLKRARDESTSDDDQWHQGWRQLGDDNKWKRFGDYWRKQDADKTCNHCSITFSYEERGRKDPQYCLPLVPETNNKIIVRECYKDLYNYIFTLRGHKYTGLILTGQPGTGKTLWLSYALVRLLTENETVAYHSSAGTFLFFENSVYSRISGLTTEFPPAKSAVFCLIDSDLGPVDIGFMTDRTVVNKTFPVVASPMPSHYGPWRKQRVSVPMELMPLWSRDELKEGLKIQWFYDDLRQHVETVLFSPSPSVDDSSTKAVSPKEMIREDWRNLILSVLEMIGDGDDSMDDATGDGTMAGLTGDNAMDNARVLGVDGVLDKLLDNAIEAYGLSAQDIYGAIFSPALSEISITALSRLKYDAFQETVMGLGLVDADNTFSHTIFSMKVKEPIGRAHLRSSLGFEVQFKSHWIQTMVLRHPEFLQHLDLPLKSKLPGRVGLPYFLNQWQPRAWHNLSEHPKLL